MSLLDPLKRLIGANPSVFAEVQADAKNPLGLKVVSYVWSNPDVMKPGIRNPFVLQLNISLESTQPLNVESFAIDLGDQTLTSFDLQPFPLQSVAGVSPRFEVPFEAANRPLGPALIVTANGLAVRTKRFRVPGVQT